MVFLLQTASNGDFLTAASKYRTDLAPSWVRNRTFPLTVLLLLQLVFYHQIEFVYAVICDVLGENKLMKVKIKVN